MWYVILRSPQIELAATEILVLADIKRDIIDPLADLVEPFSEKFELVLHRDSLGVEPCFNIVIHSDYVNPRRVPLRHRLGLLMGDVGLE